MENLYHLGLSIHCGPLRRASSLLPFALALNKTSLESSVILLCQGDLLEYSTALARQHGSIDLRERRSLGPRPSHPRLSTLRCLVRYTSWVIRAEEGSLQILRLWYRKSVIRPRRFDRKTTNLSARRYYSNGGAIAAAWNLAFGSMAMVLCAALPNGAPYASVSVCSEHATTALDGTRAWTRTSNSTNTVDLNLIHKLVVILRP